MSHLRRAAAPLLLLVLWACACSRAAARVGQPGDPQAQAADDQSGVEGQHRTRTLAAVPASAGATTGPGNVILVTYVAPNPPVASLFKCVGVRVPAGSGPDLAAPARLVPGTQQLLCAYPPGTYASGAVYVFSVFMKVPVYSSRGRVPYSGYTYAQVAQSAPFLAPSIPSKLYVGLDIVQNGFYLVRCHAEDVSQCAGQAGTPSAIPGSVRGIRVEPTSKAVFMASGSSIAICTDANNTAAISGCVVDSAGGLLSTAFDLDFKDSMVFIADRGVSSSSAGDGWIVRCSISGLGTASPSLSSCSKLYGTNTGGTTGSAGNNVNFDRPLGLFINESTMYVSNTGSTKGVTICTIDGSYNLVQCSNNFGLQTDGTTTAWTGARSVNFHGTRAYVTTNQGVWICTEAAQLKSCTKTLVTILTDTTNPSSGTPVQFISAYGTTFYNGKLYMNDYKAGAQSAVVICDDPVALTGCSKYFGCTGASTPATIDKGCASSDNTLNGPLRMAIIPP